MIRWVLLAFLCLGGSGCVVATAYVYILPQDTPATQPAEKGAP